MAGQAVTVPTPTLPIGGGDMQNALVQLETAVNAALASPRARILKTFKYSTAIQTLVSSALNYITSTALGGNFQLPKTTTLINALGNCEDIFIIKGNASTVASTVVPQSSSNVKIYGCPNTTIAPIGSSTGRVKITLNHKFQTIRLVPLSSVAWLNVAAGPSYFKSS